MRPLRLLLLLGILAGPLAVVGYLAYPEVAEFVASLPLHSSDTPPAAEQPPNLSGRWRVETVTVNGVPSDHKFDELEFDGNAVEYRPSAAQLTDARNGPPPSVS